MMGVNLNEFSILVRLTSRAESQVGLSFKHARTTRFGVLHGLQRVFIALNLCDLDPVIWHVSGLSVLNGGFRK